MNSLKQEILFIQNVVFCIRFNHYRNFHCLESVRQVQIVVPWNSGVT